MLSAEGVTNLIVNTRCAQSSYLEIFLQNEGNGVSSVCAARCHTPILIAVPMMQQFPCRYCINEG